MNDPRPALLLICLLLSALAAAQIADVPIVGNAAAPAEGIHVQTMTEIWRAGGDDEDIFFGSVPDVRGDTEGNTWVLDSQLCVVHRFGPDGERVATLGGAGEGPGETRAPRRCLLMPAGRIGLCDWYPARCVLLDEAGDPAGQFNLAGRDPGGPGFSILVSADCCDGVLACGTSEMGAGEDPMVQTRHTSLCLYDETGARTANLFGEEYVLDLHQGVFSERRHMDWCGRRFAVGPGGRIFSVPERDHYRVHVFSPAGAPELVIERSIHVRRRTDAEYGFFKSVIEGMYASLPFDVRAEIERDMPPVALFPPAVHPRGDGSVWILSSDGVVDQPAGVMLTYDVFDPGGRFSRQVRMACPGDAAHDALFLTADDRAVLVRGWLDAMLAGLGGGGTEGDVGEAEAQNLEIVCYGLD